MMTGIFLDPIKSRLTYPSIFDKVTTKLGNFVSGKRDSAQKKFPSFNHDLFTFGIVLGKVVKTRFCRQGGFQNNRNETGWQSSTLNNTASIYKIFGV